MLQTLFHHLFGHVCSCFERSKATEIPLFVHDYLFLQDVHKVFNVFSKLCLSVNPSKSILLVTCNLLEQAHTGSWEPIESLFLSLSCCVLKPGTLPYLSLNSVIFVLHLIAFLSWFSSISFLNSTGWVLLSILVVFLSLR